MWSLKNEWHEIVLRGFFLFTFLFITFRLWGKKHFSELSPFDFLLLLIISEAVQNALLDDDHSLTAGFISVATLILLNAFLGKMAFHFPRLEKLFDGEPKVLVEDGVLNDELRKKLTITHQELYEAIRLQGVETLSDIHKATMETNGKISVIKKEDK